MEVVKLMSRGMSNPAISDHLGIGLETAKWHVANIMAKTGATSRAEAAAIGMRWNRPAARLYRKLRSLLAVPLLVKAGTVVVAGGAATAGAVAAGIVAWPGSGGDLNAASGNLEAVVAHVSASGQELIVIARANGAAACLWVAPPDGAWRAGGCGERQAVPVSVLIYPWTGLEGVVVTYGSVEPDVDRLEWMPPGGQPVGIELAQAATGLATDARFFGIAHESPPPTVTIRALNAAGEVIYSEDLRLVGTN